MYVSTFRRYRRLVQYHGTTPESVRTLPAHRSASHNPKAYVPESALDDSLHYVVWGHEHEQRISPEAVSEKNYYISQPGSTVVTSLSPGEVTQKCAAIVQVCGKDFKVEPIPLETVRPFVMKDINLTSEAATARIDPTDRISVTKLLRQHVRTLPSDLD